MLPAIRTILETDDGNTNMVSPLVPTELPTEIIGELPEKTQRALHIYNKHLTELNNQPIDPEGLMVVIPAHNEGRTIGKTLKSLYQNLPTGNTETQVVVSLDGCTDNTILTVEQFAKETGLSVDKIIITKEGDVIRETHDSDNPNAPRITVIDKQYNAGKLDAIMQIPNVLIGDKGILPANVLLLDADTPVPSNSINRLLEKRKEKNAPVGVSGRVKFDGQTLPAFAKTINSIHGYEHLGGDWIPGAFSMWDTRAFLAGYKTIQEVLPELKVEDAGMALLTRLAGLRTKVLMDLPFDTLSATKENVDAQMMRWLEGAEQLREIFGPVLKDLGMEAPLMAIVAHQIQEVIGNAKTPSEVFKAIEKVAVRTPFIYRYITAKRLAKQNIKNERRTNDGANNNTPTRYTWNPART